MNTFAEKWRPRWEVEASYPGCEFLTILDGTFRSGRPRYCWVAKRGGIRVSQRDAMELISKAGNPYFVVSIKERKAQEDWGRVHFGPLGVGDVYD